MSWIGLRDNVGGVFSPIGLGRANRAPFGLDAVMPRGTLMLEFASDPRGGVQTLLDTDTVSVAGRSTARPQTCD